MRKIPLAQIIFIIISAAMVFLVLQYGSLTGMTVLDSAEVFAGQDTYNLGDLVHLFVVPSEADYTLEVYDPDSHIYALSENFPAEKIGTYFVNATITLEDQSRVVSTTFEVVAPVSEPAPEKTQAEEESESEQLTNFGNESTQVAPKINDTLKDSHNNTVGKKIEDEEDFETFFTFVGKVDNEFIISFHHNSTSIQPIWVEGDLDYELTALTAQANETVNLTVPLEGLTSLPKFNLHVGLESEVFEFDLEIIINVDNTSNGSTDIDLNASIIPEDLLNRSIEFTTADMTEETVYDHNNHLLEVTSIQKDGILIEVRGADKDRLNNVTFNQGVLHMDSVSIKNATIRIPHGLEPGIRKSPKLFVREDGEPGWSEATAYCNNKTIQVERDTSNCTPEDMFCLPKIENVSISVTDHGNCFNKVDITPTHYEFTVEHFTDYYVNISGGGDYTSVEDCLDAINNTADTCNINIGNHLETIGRKMYYTNGSSIYIAANNISLDFNKTIFDAKTPGSGTVIIVPSLSEDSYKNILISNLIIIGYENGLSLNGINNSNVTNISSMNAKLSIIGDNLRISNIDINNSRFDLGIKNTYVNRIFMRNMSDNLVVKAYSVNNTFMNMELNASTAIVNSQLILFSANSDYNNLSNIYVNCSSYVQKNKFIIKTTSGGDNTGYMINNSIIENCWIGIDAAKMVEMSILNNTFLGGGTAANITTRYNTFANNTINQTSIQYLSSSSPHTYGGIDFSDCIAYVNSAGTDLSRAPYDDSDATFGNLGNSIVDGIHNFTRFWLFTDDNNLLGCGAYANATIYLEDGYPYTCAVASGSYGGTCRLALEDNRVWTTNGPGNNYTFNSSILAIAPVITGYTSPSYLRASSMPHLRISGDSSLYPKNHSITGNIFIGTYPMVYSIDSSANHTRFWLNTFYTAGINHTGFNNSFCFNGQGNFYADDIPVSSIGNGTGINGIYIGGDCGPSFITGPVGAEAYLQSQKNITINWTNQSSRRNISYHVFYSMDEGKSWNYINSTHYLNYTWNISLLPNNKRYVVKVVPFDDIYNATNSNSSRFTIGPNNTYVCLNTTLCQHINLTTALLEENKTNSTIILYQRNYTYNASPKGSYSWVSINMSMSNQSLQCFGSALAGPYGYGVLVSGENSTVADCSLSNYTYGIIIGTTFTNITNNTIEYSDLFDLDITSSLNKIIHNRFYSKGIQDIGQSNIYCFEGQGNYYANEVPRTAIGNGTGEEGTKIGGDCGISNFTSAPAGTFSQYDLTLNWTNQTSQNGSVNNISYQLFYSNDSQQTLMYINSTEFTNYTWNITYVDDGTYSVILLPFDGMYNGTNDTIIVLLDRGRNLSFINQTWNQSGTEVIINETEAIPQGENLTIKVRVASALNSISTVWIKIWDTVKGAGAVIWEGLLTIISGTTSDGIWAINVSINSSFIKAQLQNYTLNYTIYANETDTNYTMEIEGNFTVRPDNEFVCSNSNICEYNNLTGALIGENNTNNTISLLDQGTYSITGGGSYNITPPNASPVIRLNTTNIYLDCNGAEFVGNLTGIGIGIYSNYSTVRECNLTNYTYGIIIDNSRYINLTLNTLKGTAINDLNITDTSRDMQVWANNFYGKPVIDQSTGSIYCYNGDPSLGTESSIILALNFQEDISSATSDKSGNHNIATLYPNQTDGPQRTRGKYYKSMQFDGIDDYLVSSIDLDISSEGNLTVEAWFKTSSNSQTLIGINKSFSSPFNISTDNPIYSIHGADTLGRLGSSVSFGDINGDGYDDMIIGALTAEPSGGSSDEGEVYVIYGGLYSKTYNLTSNNADWIIRGHSLNVRLGSGIGSGDVNGDGYDDIIAGASGDSRVFVIFGGAYDSREINLSTQNANITLKGVSGAGLGGSVSSGDVNGDGYDDILAGAMTDDGSYTDSGKAYVLFGDDFLHNETIDLTTQSANITISGNFVYSHLGRSMTSGDINGDGYDDIIAGSENAYNPKYFATGAAYVLYGDNFTSPQTIDLKTQSANLTVYGAHENDDLGYVVSSGDINGDGYDDLITSSYIKNIGGVFEAGQAYVIFGQDYTTYAVDLNNINAVANITINGSYGVDLLGYSLSSEDINNDGYYDVVMGGFGANNFSGEVNVLYGGSQYLSPTSIASTDSNITLYGNTDYQLGNSVSTGDFNGDNFPEILAGALNAENQDGKSFLFDVSSSILELNIGSDSKINAVIGGTNGSVVSQGTSTVSNGNWHHLVYVKDNQIKLYVDGSLQDTDSYTSNNLNLSGLVIGTLTTNGNLSRYYNGYLDSVVVYERSLGQLEILQHYTAGKGSGNYYNVLSNRSYIKYLLDDCGIIDITEPEMNDNFTGSMRIEWQGQSATSTVTYYLSYSNNSGVNWYAIDSTTNNYYDWGISSLPDGNDYYVSVMPYDTRYNGTNVTSEIFGIHNSPPLLIFINQTNLSNIPVNSTYPTRSNEVVAIIINASNQYGVDTVWIDVFNTTYDSTIVWQGLFNLTHGSIFNGTWRINMTVNESFPEMGIVNYSINVNGSVNNSYSMDWNLSILDNEYVCADTELCEYQSFDDVLSEETGKNNTIMFLDSNADYQSNAGTYYLYPSSGRSAIEFNASGITLDCHGATILGSYIGYGAFIDRVDNISLINCRIGKYLTGINITNSTGGNISGSSSFDNLGKGIWVNNLQNGILEYMNVSNNSQDNIYLLSSNYTNLTDLKISHSSGSGINISNSYMDFIEDVKSEYNIYESLFIDSTSNTLLIHNSTFKNSTLSNIVTIYGDYMNLSGNSFSESPAGKYDLELMSTSTLNRLWLNNFYTSGIKDSSVGSIFCVEVLSNLQGGIYTAAPLFKSFGNYFKDIINSTYAPKGSCGALTEAFDDSDHDGYYALTIDCSDNHTERYPGGFEFCDEYDNDCDGQIDEEQACGADSFPSAGTSGGAGLAGFVMDKKRREQNIIDNPIVVLYKGDVLVFQLKGTEQSIKLNKVYFDKVNLSVISINEDFIFKINESFSLDLDNDGLDDLEIVLSSIDDAAAVFNLKEVTMETKGDVTVLPEEKETGKEEEKPPVEKQPSALTNIYDFAKIILKYGFIVIVSVAIFVSLAAGALTYRRFIGNVKKAEDYVREAMQNRVPKAKIRRKLIEAGWEPEVVDSILQMESNSMQSDGQVSIEKVLKEEK